MVNKTLICLLVLLLSMGCFYTGKRTTYGLPRRKLSIIKGENSPYNYVDTNVLYKAVISFQYNTSLKKNSYYEQFDSNPYPYASYLKFYSNGKLGLFVIHRNDTVNLTKDNFNPLKAKMGYFGVNNKVIFTKIATMGDGTLYISNEKGYIKNDTLSLEDKNHHVTLYVKSVVSPELFKNWIPDW
jgi:hypothetical protein